MSVKLITLLIVCLSVLDQSVNSIRIEDYDYFYPYKFINMMRDQINMVSSKPVKSYSKLKLIVVNIEGLAAWDLANVSIPNINKHFVKNGAKASLTLTSGQVPVSVPVWLENQSVIKGKSAIIGSLPGGNMKYSNQTVAYLNDVRDKLDWFDKVDRLIELVSNEKNKKLNLAVLHLADLKAVKQRYGCESTNLVKSFIADLDRLVNYIVVRLTDLDLFNNVNIILTTNFGVKTEQIASQQKVNLKNFALKIKNQISRDSLKSNNSTNKGQVLKKLSLKTLKGDIKILSVIKANLTEDKDKSKCLNIEAENVGVFLARGPAFRKTNSKNVTIDLSDVYQITRQVLGIECNSTECESSLDKLSDIVKVKKTLNQQFQQIVDLIANTTAQRVLNNVTEKLEQITTTTNATTTSTSSTTSSTTTIVTTTLSAKSSILPLVGDMEKFINSNLTVEFKKFYKFIDQHYDNVKFVNFMHLFVLFVILCAFIIIIHFNTKRISAANQYRPLNN